MMEATYGAGHSVERKDLGENNGPAVLLCRERSCETKHWPFLPNGTPSIL